MAIRDLTTEIFGEMLEFIYTGKSPNLERLANQLLSAADKVREALISARYFIKE